MSELENKTTIPSCFVLASLWYIVFKCSFLRMHDLTKSNSGHVEWSLGIIAIDVSQITKEYNDYFRKNRKQEGSREYCSCAEACKQMQKGSENKSALLFLVLKCEILSISGSLNQYEHGIIYTVNLTLQSARQELQRGPYCSCLW